MRLLSLIITPALLAPAVAKAIPAWSKKYNLPCYICHRAGGNRLTEFGKDFLLRGHRTPDEQPLKSFRNLRLDEYMNLVTKATLTARNGERTRLRFDEETPMGGGALPGNWNAFLSNPFTDLVSSKLSAGYVGFTGDISKMEYWFARAGKFEPYIISGNGYGGPRNGISLPSPLVQSATTNNGVAAGYRFGDLFVEAGLMQKSNFSSIEKEFGAFGSSAGLFVVDGRSGFLGALNRSSYSLTGSYIGRRDYHLQAEAYFGEALTGYLRYERSSEAGVIGGLSYRLPRGRAVVEAAENKTGAAIVRTFRARLVWAL